MEIQAKSTSDGTKENSSMAGVMGLLLPAIAKSPEFFEADKIADGKSGAPPDANLVKQFRNAWFYLVLIHMVDEDKWSDDWFSAVQAIAVRSPALLVSSSSDDYLDKQVQSLYLSLLVSYNLFS